MSSSVGNSWLSDLQRRIRSFATDHQFEQGVLADLREFVMSVAREQYMTGNKSGIRWARSQSSTQAAHA